MSALQRVFVAGRFSVMGIFLVVKGTDSVVKG